MAIKVKQNGVWVEVATAGSGSTDGYADRLCAAGIGEAGRI